MRKSHLIASLFVLLWPQAASAAPALDGASMSWPLGLPFAGLLLTIATGPLLFPKFWHAHYGKIAAVWSILALVPLAIGFGPQTAFAAFVHAAVAEYASFIVLLFALYMVAGGILVTGQIRATPLSISRCCWRSAPGWRVSSAPPAPP